MHHHDLIPYENAVGAGQLVACAILIALLYIVLAPYLDRPKRKPPYPPTKP